MGETESSIYRIKKLQGIKNWSQWETDIKSALVLAGLWSYVSGRKKDPIKPEPPSGTTQQTAGPNGSQLATVIPASATELEQYQKDLSRYEVAVEDHDEKHEKAVAMLDITCEPGPRVHIKGFTNSEAAYLKLVQQYGTTDLATIDMSLQEICRTNMSDKGSVGAYAEHLKRHDNEIRSAGQAIPDWMMSSFFRMGLPSHLNPYIFQLVHAAAANKKLLSIDDMVAALVDQDKRESYNEDKTDTARSAKIGKSNTKPKNTKSKSSDNNKKDRGEGPCGGCGVLKGHDRKHCYYENSAQRPPGWKPFETKVHLAKDWPDKNDFIPAGKDSKPAGRGKVKRVLSTTSIRSESSESSESSYASKFSEEPSTPRNVVSMGKARRVRVRNNVYLNNCAKRISRTMASKDPDFYLDSAADCHMSHDKSLFNELRPLATAKTVEVANGQLVSVKGIGSITFELNIFGKRVHNTVTNVEYVPDLNYNLLSTGTLERKGCEISQKGGRLLVTDEEDNVVFMTGTRQLPSVGNSYILDLWKPIINKTKSAKTPISWTEWHRRLGHLNMSDVKKLAAMGLFDSNECNKLEKLEPTKRCEACMADKQHRTPNHKPVRSNPLKRATRKGQRFHTDLAEGGHIVRTPKGKRYVIIFVDDYSDYTWVYLVAKKSEFTKVLRNFIVMIKAQGHSIESFRVDNAKENINKETIALLQEHGIKWEPTVPDNPHQNGMAERAFRTIFNRVRACLFDSMLPKTLWGEACHTVVYNKNISPTSSLDEKTLDESTGRYAHEFKTPHEAWFDTKPDITHLRPFRTLCYTNLEHTKRLDAQGTQCRLLGYGGSNQYLVYEPETRMVYRAAHIVFDDYTKPPEIGDEDDDFAYLTLDFSPEQSADEERLTESGNQHTIENSTDSAFPRSTAVDPGHEAQNEAQNSTPESDIDSGSEDASDINPINPEEGQNPIIPPAALPAPSDPAPPPSPRRSRRQLVQPDFAHISSPWNKHFGGQGMADPGSASGSKGFAVRVRKTRKIDLDYQIPTNWAEVQLHPDKEQYVQAAREEINHHKVNGTWEVLMPPPKVRIIPGRWVFAIKRGADGEIVKYKARWVAKGFRQVEGTDYFETYSGVVKSMLWKCMLALAAKHNYEAHHVDIVSAFLEADLHYKQWVEQPHGFEQGASRGTKREVCRLDKALYGLKQSPREWYDCLKAVLVSFGYQCLKMDNCIFKHENGIIISVFVDDMLIIGSHLKDIIALKAQLRTRFRIKDLGDLSFYLGIKVVRDRELRTIWLSQPAFIKQLIKDCGLENCKPASTPMEQYTFRANIHNGVEYKASEDEIQAYRIILGSLQWLSISTRPDISYATNKLSTYTSNPTPTHSDALQRIVRYLVGTIELGLRFGPILKLLGDLLGFSDSSYADDPDTSRSHSGYLFMLWNGPVSHSSKRQQTVATSTAEAEYMGQSNAAKEAYFLAGALDEMGFTIEGPVHLRADNQAAIKLAHNPVNHSRTKHIAVRYHYVRELIEQDLLKITYINTKDMAADGLTKALKPELFKGFVRMLGLASSPT